MNGTVTAAVSPASERAIRNVLSNSLGKVVTLGANLLLTPFLVWHLGAAHYGLLTLVGSVVTYGLLLDFGMINTVIKHVAEYRARKDDGSAAAIVSTALLLYSVAGVIAVALSVALAPVVPRLFNIPEADRLTAWWLVVLSGLGIGISLPCAITTGVLRGLQRYDLVNLVQVIVSALYVSGSVIILLLGGGVVALSAVGIAATLLGQLPSFWFVRRIAPALRFTYRRASRTMAARLLTFSSWLFVNDLAGLLQMKTDVIVIGALLPVAAVTPYAVCQKLSRVPKILTEQFVKILLPMASELNAREDLRRLRMMYIWSSRLTLAIFIPIGCTLALLSREALTVWMGPSYAAYSPLVVVLVLALGIDIAQWPAASILQGMARVRGLALVAIAVGLANLALSVVLAPRLGLIGIALGTVIPTVASLGVVTPYAMHHIGVRARDLLTEVVRPTVMPAVPAVAVVYGLRGHFAPTSAWSLVAIACAGVIVYLAVYLSCGASRAEQQTYRGFAANTIRVAESYFRRRPISSEDSQ